MLRDMQPHITVGASASAAHLNLCSVPRRAPNMRLLRFFMAGFSSLSSLGRFATAGSSGSSASCVR